MPLPSEREMDVLLATGEQTTIALAAIALHAINVPAVSLTGAQAGIVTDGVHTKAKIQNITPKRIHDLLNQGKVVIVAGFQGETIEGQVTTLGRGGSDLTAIALAAALRADLAKSTQTSMVSIPPTRGSCPGPENSRRSPTTRCSSWPASAPKSCNRAP
jgi:aspartate kinase